ncbi:MAG: sigma-70 family RNA polymerase sigma factor [[Eubacterium] siraeum]|nr:sigma-70 family RNA polymerase sigma factor [[Eubacterium] siraeum]
MDFEQLYKAYYMQVYSYMMTMCRNPELAEEITQKAFYKALLNIGKYRGEASQLTWLCTIAKNIYMDMLRREKKRGSLPDEVPSGEDMTARAEDKDSAFRIHQILHQMEEPYKEVFQLRVFGELSFAKIGELFGKSESWARVTYYRAKNKVKDRLDES